MSAYREIRTEFRNLKSLLEALTAIGYDSSKVQVAEDPKQNTLGMYGYHNDLRRERCAVRIDRKNISPFSNDVGFFWDGSSYSAIISDYDSTNKHWCKQVRDRLAQEYSVREVQRQAKLRGYQVQKEHSADGSIRLVLKRS